MKLGLISDIHGNYEALREVLKALEQEECVKILCCGDIVGYGPSPVACVETVQEKRIASVRGNHDALMMASDKAADLRWDVKESIEWTYQQLSEEQREWLGKLPKVQEYGGIEVIHSSHVLKPEWLYVLDEKSAMANFLFQGHSISFNGHTHVPMLALHKYGFRPKLFPFSNTALPPHHRCLVNVGSVGQPRDRNPEAAYGVFDTRSREIQIKRVPYNISRTQQNMRKAGLPERLIKRLEEGR